MNDKISELISFCEKYNEWPKIYRNPENDFEEESNKISYWLKSMHYLSPKVKFKYEDFKTEDNIPLKYLLDDLYLKYGKKNKLFAYYLTTKLKEVVDFCYKYNSWPYYIKEAKTEKEIASNHYALWLENVGYTPDSKFHQELTFENGNPIYQELDFLNKRLYLSDAEREYILNKVNEIKEYCVVYRSWPTAEIFENEKRTKVANELCKWLEETGYSTNEFKYMRLCDIHGTPIKTILDNYYHVYRPTDYEELFNSLNIWHLKDSTDKIVALSGYIIELSNTIYSNYELFEYYISIIKERLKELNLKLEIKDIISDLTLGFNEQAKIYYKKYLDYQDNDLELARLYLNLFDYAKAINNSINKEKEEKRRK